MRRSKWACPCCGREHYGTESRPCAFCTFDGRPVKTVQASWVNIDLRRQANPASYPNWRKVNTYGR